LFDARSKQATYYQDRHVIGRWATTVWRTKAQRMTIYGRPVSGDGFPAIKRLAWIASSKPNSFTIYAH